MIYDKNSKETEALREQLRRLDDRDFELNAWKIHTLIILERIFGSGSHKLAQLEKINYDFSSWSLRDTSGTTGSQDSCKKKAAEIIQASIEELETFGIPEINDKNNEELEKNVAVKDILGIFEDELKGSQMKELKAILSSVDNPANLKSRLVGKLKEFGVNVSPEILALILMNKNISQLV